MIKSTFEIKSTSTTAWGLQARRLKRAADLLFARYCEDSDRMIRNEATAIELSDGLEMIMPASLLYGLALENMFKAIIIQIKKPTGADIPSLFGGGSGHSLADLAHRARFNLSNEELGLVNRLSLFIEWAGRYPVAKKLTKMVLKQNAIVGEWFPLPLAQYEGALLESLFKRADAVIFS